MRNYYKPGDWNAICDRCGFKFKASQLREDWQGLMVCEEDFETRHPMDFLKTYPDKIGVPWTRLDIDDTVLVVVASPPTINGTSINTFTIG